MPRPKGSKNKVYKGIIKKCLFCGKEFYVPQWLGKIRKYCCYKCYSKGSKTQFKKGEHLNENNHNWKGNKVGYIGLHQWVRRRKGKAKKCEFCGKTTGRIEWANKDHKYTRNPNDYISLCIFCHKKYDKTIK